MEVTETDSRPIPPTTSQRFRTMIRQNSEKVGAVAEIMLPRNKRSMKKGQVDDDVLDGIDLETHLPPKSKVEVPVKKFPIFIVTISFIQIMIFLFGDVHTILALCYDPYRRHELWRYLTEMLVHKTLSHILGNLFFQLILGLLLEIVHHWKRISAVYLAGVVGGALAVTIFDPKQYSLGASAGVYGLLLAHLATIILNWDQMDCIFYRFFCLMLYFLWDVGSTLYVTVYINMDSQVSHVGHVGGAIGGFVAAVFWLRNFEKLAWEKTLQRFLRIVTGLILIGVVVINVAFPSHYLPSEFNFHYVDTFIRYVLQSLQGTPEGLKVAEECRADAECRSMFGELLNDIETTMISDL